MNTTTAATQAGVTIATIRTWCRRGVITATKHAGRWVIDAASLAYRIGLAALTSRKEKTVTEPQPDPASARELIAEININVAQAAAVNSVPALRRLLAYVEARDIAAFVVNPAGVHPTQQQWDDSAAYITATISSLRSESRTAAAIYDYD